jgi:hypothetical protein
MPRHSHKRRASTALKTWLERVAAERGCDPALLLDLWRAQQGRCAETGGAFSMRARLPLERPNAPVPMLIDPGKGKQPGNLRLVKAAIAYPIEEHERQTLKEIADFEEARWSTWAEEMLAVSQTRKLTKLERFYLRDAVRSAIYQLAHDHHRLPPEPLQRLQGVVVLHEAWPPRPMGRYAVHHRLDRVQNLKKFNEAIEYMIKEFPNKLEDPNSIIGIISKSIQYREIKTIESWFLENLDFHYAIEQGRAKWLGRKGIGRAHWFFGLGILSAVHPTWTPAQLLAAFERAGDTKLLDPVSGETIKQLDAATIASWLPRPEMMRLQQEYRVIYEKRRNKNALPEWWEALHPRIAQQLKA